MVACYNNQPQVASYLVKLSSARELDAQDDRGSMALHWAIVNTRNVDLVRQICKKAQTPTSNGAITRRP
jgi:ankyrin repeat protein